MITRHCHFKDHQSTVSPTCPKSLPLLENQMAQRLECVFGEFCRPLKTAFSTRDR